jgi:GPH family glycoside/pentoside/hexuronide:cation symporter
VSAPGSRSSADEEPLPRGLILGWGIGSLGASALHNGISFLALFYLSSVLGLAPALAGTLILVAKVYDIVTDPLVGWLSDRTDSRWGRRRPWLLAGALFSATALIVLFNPPVSSASGQLVTTVLALLLYATGYTLFGVPYMAMPAEMTGNYHERSRLMSARTIFLTLGILAGGALAPALVVAFGGGPAGYARMSWIMAGIVLAGMLGAVAGTRHARATQPAASGRLPSSASPWRSALGNRPFRTLIASKFCHLTGVAVSMSSLAFLVTGVLGRSEAAMGLFVVASAAGSILSMPLWLAVSRHRGKRDAYLLAAACYLPVVASWLLANPGEATAVFLARGFLTGLATGGLTLTAQAMLPDTIEHDFRRTGLRREAMYSAVYSIAEKLASATGPFLLGLVLSAATGTRTLVLAAVVIPITASLLSGVVLLFYGLDRELRAGNTVAADA